VRPEVESDVTEAAAWYDARQEGLGDEFVKEVLRVFQALEINPFLSSRRHPRRNIRWRYTDRFSYRVIYEILENEHVVIIAAVLHAARHERHWRKRL
jgi:mRNA-degrading endonuclease RelE of RelBE toxin-antitoxin system